MGRKYIYTVASFICLYSLFKTSTAISGADLGAIQRLVALGNLENEAETPGQNVPPYLGDPQRMYKPFTLIDILNTRVHSTRDLCSPESVREYMSTGNLGPLIKCKQSVEQRRNITAQEKDIDSMPVSTGPKVLESYSGKLLKRLFANGFSKFKSRIPAREIMDDADDDVSREERPKKRSRLSINGALGSLVDMLQQESRPQQRRPVYAFHRELLHLG